MNYIELKYQEAEICTPISKLYIKLGQFETNAVSSVNDVYERLFATHALLPV
jgi:hypothetical protein